MSDRLASAVHWMTGKLLDFSSVQCTYTRGELTEAVVMRRSSLPTQVIDLQAVTVEWQPVDFLIQTIALPFGRPQRGDQIVCVIQGDEVVHEVFALGTEKPWRDVANAMTRIHTKVIN